MEIGAWWIRSGGEAIPRGSQEDVVSVQARIAKVPAYEHLVEYGRGLGAPMKAGTLNSPQPRSFRVVKNDSKRATLAPADPTYTVTQVDSVRATRAPYRSMVHGKDHCITLRQ